MLESANEPVTDLSYFECLDSVMEKSKLLGDSMTGITDHAKKGDLENFCDSVGNFSTSVGGLTEAASQLRTPRSVVTVYRRRGRSVTAGTETTVQINAVTPGTT